MTLKTETKVGIISFILFLILLWGLNFLKGRNILIKENSYYTYFNDVTGLSDASPVAINGYKIGNVKQFHITNNNKILVEYTIDKKRKIPLNSVVFLQSKDLLGTMELSFSFNDTNSYYSKGDTIIGYTKEGIINKIVRKVIPIANNLDSTIININRILNENFNDTEIGEIISKLNRTSSELEYLIRTERKKIASITSSFNELGNTLEENNSNIDTTLNNLSTISSQLANSKLDSTLYNINKISESLSKTESTAGKLINEDSLYTELETTVKSLDALINDLQENPRKYINLSVFGGKGE